jgi:hypothetical protein
MPAALEKVSAACCTSPDHDTAAFGAKLASLIRAGGLLEALALPIAPSIPLAKPIYESFFRKIDRDSWQLEKLLDQD